MVASEAILDSFAIDEPPATAAADPKLPLDAPPPGKVVALNWKPPGDRPQEHLPQPPERMGSTENLTGMSATERLLRTVTDAEDALAIKTRRELIVARGLQGLGRRFREVGRHQDLLHRAGVHGGVQARHHAGTGQAPARRSGQQIRRRRRRAVS